MEKEKKVLIKTYSVSDYDKSKIMVVVYKDEDGTKHTEFYERAVMEYYISEEHLNSPTSPLYLPPDKLTRKVVEIQDLEAAIAHDTNMSFFIDQCRYAKQISSAKNIHRHPAVYSSDMNPIDFYISVFNANYQTPIGFKYHKGFFDIEVDISKYDRFPSETEAPCPINIATYFDGKENKFYTFILNDGSNPNVPEFQAVDGAFKQRMFEIFRTKYGTEVSDIEFIYCATELELIKSFFETVNSIDPDFAMSWNQKFDLRTFENRAIKLVGRKDKKAVDNIFCDIKHRFVNGREIPTTRYYYASNKKIGDALDSYTISSGITYIDQMQIYANIRKVETQKRSYALDAIVHAELGMSKLEFGPGENIKNIPYTNFPRFVEYNMIDVLLLKLLEDKNDDIALLMAIARETNTASASAMKKTVSLKNITANRAKQKGLVISSNRNSTYGDDTIFRGIIPEIDGLEPIDTNVRNQMRLKQKYGAFVADPKLNDNVGINIFGNKNSKYIYKNIIDEDLTSLYPSITIAFNIDAMTIIGKFFLYNDKIKERLLTDYGYDGMFDSKVGCAPEEDDDEDNVPEDNISTKKKEEYENNDLSIHLVDSLVSHDWSSIGSKFFGLPTTESIINDLINEKRIEV